MLSRLILAIVFGAAVGLACIFLGLILASLDIPPVEAVAAFLRDWAWAIGVLAGLWHFFAGNGWPLNRAA